MPKRPRNFQPHLNIPPETKRIIAAIILFAFGLVFILANFQLAGPVGKLLWQTFSFLMGWGYFLLPVSFFATSFILVYGLRENILTPILGIMLAILSILGISHEFRPYHAGFLGQAVGSISVLFGFWASVVILAAIGISGVFLAFHRKVDKVFEKDKQEVKKDLSKIVRASSKEEKTTEKEISSSSFKIQPKDHTESIVFSAKTFLKNWDLPPLDLLEKDSSSPSAGDIRINANIIRRTLENFGIPVEMAEVNVGPTVTQYTLKPAQGVKLAKIVALQNDLALALAAHPIRIEAPIPGKSLVGIEVPNKAASIVRMRTLFEDARFFEEKSPLSFLLGRDVMGKPVSADLSRMPHLLIAGATGSGKSIFIHSMLISFLFRNSPHLLRLILIDPKRVELSQYQGLPHLISPVITDGKKVVGVLRWAINEMERRYATLLDSKARDIFAYNASRNDLQKEIMPFIVIVIDELADLMLTFGREIEGAVVRLAQMARATGIHLVVSTQRPSVEVITGLIKANITSRIAFQVASQVDSRTILDMAGAEKLLGFGDMLFLAPDTSKPRRIQAPYVSDREIKRVVEFLVRQGEELGEEFETGQKIEDLEKVDDFAKSTEVANDLADDPFYDEAVRVVREAKKASASLLQRRLKIGYARAARLLDIMESRGVVGPAKGAKPREVYGIDQDVKE